MEKTWYVRARSFLGETWDHFFSYRPTRMASSLSYYGLFSLVPILVITFWIGSTIINTQTLATEILKRTTSLFGPQSAAFLQTTFSNSTSLGVHPVQAVIAVLILIALAVSGIAELKDSLDDIWETPYKHEKTFVGWSLSYLIPLLATIVFGIAFVLFIVATEFLQAGFTLGISPAIVQFVTAIGAPIAVFIVTTAGTFIAYTLLPERYIKRSRLLAGSIISGIFLTVGNIALSFYLTQATTLSTYGVAGSIVAVLLWFYYSSLIFLFVASAMWVYHKHQEGDPV